ncbi:MAG: hypothetical protein KBC30_11575, partial [Planctomycetes bacterium]|nr:hypothetical protein [Planctomycetota bacterium]
GPLWTDMIEKYGLHIDFCYRSFPWDQESEETILYRERQLELAFTRKQGAQKKGRKKKEEKQERIKKARVHCVIIGFSQTKNNKDKIIYTYTQKPIDDYLENKKTQRKYETIVTKQIANNINPYLMDAPNIIVKNRSTPLCDVPKMIVGNSPIDGGNLIIEEKDYEEFIKKEPKAKKFIKKLIGAEEFIHNKDRYVLWLVDATPQEILSMPLVYDRVQKVRETRLNSIDPSARRLATTPSLYRDQNNPKQTIVIPVVSSERRDYIPMDFVPHTTICKNSLLLIPDCPLYIFAILNSQVHNAWMRVVAGRLKSDYRYSASGVYNNFPFPELTETQKQKLNELGQNILDARAKYPDSNLAALYDPNTMPPALRKAHQKLDKEVAKIYNKNWDLNNEAEIVSDLMQMYQQLLTTDNKDKQTTETEDDETTDNKNIETTEHTETEDTDNVEITDKKESRKTKAKTKRQTKKTDNNETETEIYASIPITSKRSIKKVATKATKATIKSTTTKKREKKVGKPKATATKKETTLKVRKATTSKATKATTTKEY